MAELNPHVTQDQAERKEAANIPNAETNKERTSGSNGFLRAQADPKSGR